MRKGRFNYLDGPYYASYYWWDYWPNTYRYSDEDLGRPLYFFNFEQQADIVADYYMNQIAVEHRDRARSTIRGFNTQPPGLDVRDYYNTHNPFMKDDWGYSYPDGCPRKAIR